jgi:hypothetical protein
VSADPVERVTAIFATELIAMQDQCEPVEMIRWLENLREMVLAVIRPLGACGPCLLGVHGDCLRLDGDECGCTGTPRCGAALRVFSADAPVRPS